MRRELQGKEECVGDMHKGLKYNYRGVSQKCIDSMNKCLKGRGGLKAGEIVSEENGRKYRV